MLFSRGGLLVEGIAEQLVVPAIARRIGLPLHEHGVTVVNVDGLAFGPFVQLFGSTDRLPQRCGLITNGYAEPNDLDGDDPPCPSLPKPFAIGSQNGQTLRSSSEPRRSSVSSGSLGSGRVIMDALGKVHRTRASQLRRSPPTTGQGRGKALLEVLKANRSKGRFAQALAGVLDAGAAFTPPKYAARG